MDRVGAYFYESKPIRLSDSMGKTLREKLSEILDSITPATPFMIPNKLSSTTADDIKKALDVFESTHNLDANKEEDTKEEDVPPFMQVSGELNKEENNDEAQVEIPTAQDAVTPIENTLSEANQTMDNNMNQTVNPVDTTAEVQPQHSSYSEYMDAFKAKIGTDKYENHEENNIQGPQSYEDPYTRDFKVHTNDAPMNVNANNMNVTTTSEMSDIEKEEIESLISGYSNYNTMSFNELKKIQDGCRTYVIDAQETMNKARDDINDVYSQIDARNSQIRQLEAQINALKDENRVDNESVADIQKVYSEANTKKSLASEKLDEIQEYVSGALSAFNSNMTGSYGMQNNSYEQPDMGGYGRRAA